MEQTTLWDKKRDNNKREMLRIARNLFEKKGYHNTSVKELCDEVMISKTTFFNYFGSKDQLIRIIFDAAFADTEETVESRFGEEGDPVEAIECIMLCILADMSAYPVVSQTAYELMIRSEKMKTFKDGYEKLIIKYVARAQEKHLIREDITADVVAIILMGSFYSLTFAQDDVMDENKKQQIIEQILSVMKQEAPNDKH